MRRAETGAGHAAQLREGMVASAAVPSCLFLCTLPSSGVDFGMKTHERLDIERKLWTGSTNVRGHGQIRGTRDGKVVNLLAHRVMLKLYEPTPGRIVRHLCNNPICCNPRHLRLGTQLENVHDAIVAGNWPAGDRSCRANISSEQALGIQVRYREGSAAVRDLMDEFGYSRPGMMGIVLGKCWREEHAEAVRRVPEDRSIKPSHPPRGPSRKLSPEQEAEVRRRLAEGAFKKALAREFQVSPSTIRRIARDQ